MLNDTNKALKFDDIEANVDIKKSSNKLLYKMFITLNQNSREYNFIPLDLLQRDGKYQVVRDLYQQKILSIKNDINNGHPSLAKLQAEFGADVDNAFEADNYIDLIQFNNIKSYHFIREKITALTVHAEAIIENDQSDTAKAKAWSLIAEANYLSGLLTAENLKNRMLELISQNNSKDNEIKKITKFFYDALDQWDRETILYKDIINTASTFMDNISSHVNKDNIGKGILDYSTAEYRDKVDSLTEGSHHLRNKLDTLQQKKDETSNSNQGSRLTSKTLKNLLKPKLIELINLTNNVPWQSIYEFLDQYRDKLIEHKDEKIHSLSMPSNNTLKDWIINKDHENDEVSHSFLVNYAGLMPTKQKFIDFLQKNAPAEKWSTYSAIDAYLEKIEQIKSPVDDTARNPERFNQTIKVQVSLLSDSLMEDWSVKCTFNIRTCLTIWITTDEAVMEAFLGN